MIVFLMDGVRLEDLIEILKVIVLKLSGAGLLNKTMKHLLTILLCFLTFSLSAYGQESGCTYIGADNYDSTASEDDGSCTFENGVFVHPVSISTSAFSCDGQSMWLDEITFNGVSYSEAVSEIERYIEQQGFGRVKVLDITQQFLEVESCYIVVNVPNNPEYQEDQVCCPCCSGMGERPMISKITVAYSNQCLLSPCYGCTDLSAVNFDSSSIVDDGSCIYASDSCGEGTFWDEVTQTCIITTPTDTNLDGCTDLNDLMDILAAYGECAVAEFSCGDPISHEGYDYSTVQIGDQCWFSENLRYLPEVSPSSAGSETDPYYYVYGYEGSDVTAAQATSSYSWSGVLYNWPAVMTAGICPSGWHIPTDGEFTELTDFLGGESVAGYAMKDDVQWNGSNSSGWTGLPGGYRDSGGFNVEDPGVGYQGAWWSASESGSYSWLRVLIFSPESNANDVDNIFRNDISRYYGFSARCVRD
jgi:uncharacterized protein (TIGR02145 family)